MNSLEYQLTIKSANQKVDDYSLNCRSSWTVARLKQHISETHVNKPNVGDQRLIYAGNLLKDSLTLKQVFFRDSLCTELTNSSKTDFTIHLVCSTSAQKTQTNTSTSPRTPSSSSTNGTSQTGQTRTQQPLPASASTPSTNGGNSTNNQNTATSSSQSGASTNPGTPSASSSQTSDQAGPTLTDAQAYAIAQQILQTDRLSQQMPAMAIFQQLADQVAAELAQNLSMHLNLAANNDSASPTPVHLSSPPVVMSSAISSLLNSQGINLSAGTTATANTATTQANVNNLAANSIASQILYGNQPNQFNAAPQNGPNLNGDTNVNGPRVGRQAAAAAAVAGPHQQAPMPQAPIIEQPAPAQAIDPEPALQHDVIDWVYYSIRALILMVALYIHASLFRLLFIVGLLAIAYFFNRRSARRQAQAVIPPRQNPPADQQEPAAAAEVPGAGPDGAAREEDRDDNGELRRRRIPRGEGEAGEEPAVGGNNDQNNNEINDNQIDRAHRPDNAAEAGEIAQRRISFLKFCYLVVTDFLASLVPE